MCVFVSFRPPKAPRRSYSKRKSYTDISQPFNDGYAGRDSLLGGLDEDDESGSDFSPDQASTSDLSEHAEVVKESSLRSTNKAPPKLPQQDKIDDGHGSKNTDISSEVRMHDLPKRYVLNYVCG